MTFMRMLSASAAQNVTFDCVNSVVWFDKAGSTYRKAMKLMGSNDMEFTATSPEHERPTAHEDGCEVRVAFFRLSGFNLIHHHLFLSLSLSSCLSLSSPFLISFLVRSNNCFVCLTHDLTLNQIDI